MLIRREREEDHAAVYSLVKDAFAGAEHRDGTEQDLVEALRKGAAFIPPLSLVAEEDGVPVGHILFTKVQLGSNEELALAPLSVLPAYQRKGIGRALIEEGHRIGTRLGYHYSIVLGSEGYYPRMGYVPASRYGIISPFDVPDKNFMAFRLAPGGGQGLVKYAPEFGVG